MGKLKRHIIRLTPLLFILIACSTAKNVDIDKYKFLNDVLRDTVEIKITPKTVNTITEIPVLEPSLLTNYERRIKFISERLEENDIKFITQQFKDGQKFKTNELKKFGFQIITSDKLNSRTTKDEYVWKLIDKEFGNKLVTVEMPIFNKRKDKAYLRIEYLCGPNCGTGREVILLKDTDKWIVKDNLTIWVK